MTPKLCKDCRHIVDHPHGWMCGRTRMVNTVTGQPFYLKCEAERQDSWRTRFFSSGCGAAGVHWEAEVTEAPRLHCTPPEFRWETPRAD